MREDNSFDQEKQLVINKLGKPDKSRKGIVDKEALPLIRAINKLNDYYTTSSCAGRIMVFKEPVNGKKHEAEWLYVTHQEANPQDVFSSLTTIPEETLWIRMEPPIFHVACRDQQAAEKLLKLCHAKGWKRTGIISTGGRRKKQQRVMVEIIGNERLDTPIAVHGELLLGKDFIPFLIEQANKKLRVARKKLEELTTAVKQLQTTS